MLAVSSEAAALRDVRQHVLSGAARMDEPLDAHQLATALRTTPQAIHRAFATLVDEGLLQRTPAGTICPRVPSEAVIADAYAARRAIELGVALQTVGRVPQASLQTLRALMEATLPVIEAGRFTDVDRWIGVNGAFHEFMIGLAGSGALVQAYRALALETVDARLLFAREPDPRLTEDHRELVEAYEAADLDRVCAVIDTHTRRPLQLRRR